MIIDDLHYIKYFFSNSIIMTLFVNTWTILLCHMNPINITMETYMQVMQNMLKVNNYLWIDIRVLE